MWFRCSSRWILSSSASSSTPLRLWQHFRTQAWKKPRRSIKNIESTDLTSLQTRTDLHPIRLLLRPTIFTVGFVGCSFVSCAIWQYESHRAKLLQVKERWLWKEKPKQISSQLRNIWKDITEAQAVVGSVIGLNLIIFLLWRVKRLEPFLIKYFTASPYKPQLTSMILSTFSHYSGIHFLCNMYVLWSFSDPIIRVLGKEQFLAVFLSGGVLSSWLSYVFKVVTRTPNISLGASGSIMALIGVICTQYPDAKLSIIFLPFLTFSAKSGLIGIVAFDLVGTLMRWRVLDHSAHLGGVFFGIFYVKYGYKILWDSLAPVVQSWHRLREKWK